MMQSAVEQSRRPGLIKKAQELKQRIRREAPFVYDEERSERLWKIDGELTQWLKIFDGKTDDVWNDNSAFRALCSIPILGAIVAYCEEDPEKRKIGFCRQANALATMGTAYLGYKATEDTKLDQKWRAREVGAMSAVVGAMVEKVTADCVVKDPLSRAELIDGVDEIVGRQQIGRTVGGALSTLGDTLASGSGNNNPVSGRRSALTSADNDAEQELALRRMVVTGAELFQYQRELQCELEAGNVRNLDTIDAALQSLEIEVCDALKRFMIYLQNSLFQINRIVQAELNES